MSRARLARRLVLVLLLAGPASLPGGEIRIGGPAEAGRIRPLHGFNGGPVTHGGLVDLSPEWRALGVPMARLHDCHWPATDVVDLHVVFPDPGADPERPESYDFASTDEYVSQVVGTGARVLFRLGESIEHAPRKRHVHPPADPDRWAAACEGIVRHYNEGWASGFRHGIRHWEIWNEPDNRPQMWTGSDEEFLRLYVTTARRLKARFPDLSLGGPGFGHVGEVVEGRLRPTAFVERFLATCREQEIPLDFFSWHRYTDDPAVLAAFAHAIRGHLDAAGFARTESYLDEWNYLPGNDWAALRPETRGVDRERFYARLGGPEGAAFVASALVRLQDAPVDLACLFNGENTGFGPFTFHGAPRKNYFGLQAFRALLETPRRLAVENADAETTVLAGLSDDGQTLQVLLARLTPAQDDVSLAFETLPWAGRSRYEVRLVDAGNDLASIKSGSLEDRPARLTVPVRSPVVVLVRLQPAN